MSYFNQPIARIWPVINSKLISQARKSVALVNIHQTREMRLYKERTIRTMYWRGRSFDAIQYPERRRSDWQDWNYKTEIFAFSRRLQENLSEDTLRCALTHPSYNDTLKRREGELHLPMPKIETNEKLVDSGINIMNTFIRQYLRHHFDKLPEEGITAIVEWLECEPVLADIAKWIGCKEIILTSEHPPSPRSMAVTVPAVVGAINKDLGIQRAHRFIVDIIITYLNNVSITEHIWHIPNPKETLNLILANSQLPSYEPRIIFQTGVKTLEACHIVGVYNNKQFLGSGPGETLVIAEECACLDALFRLFQLTRSRRPLTYGEKSEQIDYSKHSEEHNSITKWKCRYNSDDECFESV